MGDAWEAAAGLNNTVNDAAADRDGDGLSNLLNGSRAPHRMIQIPISASRVRARSGRTSSLHGIQFPASDTGSLRAAI
jgi:hypothetical protein